MFKYFTEKLPHGFLTLSVGRLTLNVGGHLLGLFLPIFLYTFFDLDLTKVMLFYAILHTLYFFGIFIGCKKIMNKIGIKNSIRLAVVFGALFYVSLYVLNVNFGGGNFSDHNLNLVLLSLGSVIMTTLMFRTLYWVPLNTDMTKFTNKKSRGRQISLISAGMVVTAALMPFLAGWILQNHSYNIIFMISAFFYLLALLPFSKLPKTTEKYSWTLKETFQEFFSKKRRDLTLTYIAQGAENVVGIIIWPIFMWELLEGNYFEVGFLSSIVVVITLILQLSIGSITDKKKKSLILKYGSFFYAIGWLFKIFIGTAFQVFITSTYHNISKMFTITPLDTLNWEVAADQGHYVDEFTAIREMSLCVGRVLMCGLVIILIGGFAMKWIFLVAALAVLAMNFISHNNEVRRLESLPNK